MVVLELPGRIQYMSGKVNDFGAKIWGKNKLYCKYCVRFIGGVSE